MRCFANQRTGTCSDSCAFQHAFTGNCCRTRTHGSTHGTTFTRRFTFVAALEHCASTGTHDGTANGGFHVFAHCRANGRTCNCATCGFINRHGLSALSWDTAGQLIDDEGRHVNCVWKTWAWETAIEQIREVSETEYAAVPIRTGHPEGDVRLIDVLLRPEVLVFEPLWTVIPGNKAILPVLWQLFPNHRYLLDTDFDVNDLLKQTGYAVKPIAGRCGSNIDLISSQDELLDKSSGKFVDRKNIYQQLWCLPNVDGKYIQVCTFTVGGNYGGTCLRGDDTLVVKKESDIEPLIVVKDE